MSPERFVRSIAHRLPDDPTLVRLFSCSPRRAPTPIPRDWLPILDVAPGRSNRRVSSRPFGAWTRGDGRLLWIGSRVNVETPGALHEHVFVVLVDDDR